MRLLPMVLAPIICQLIGPHSLDEVRAAYMKQLEVVQSLDARVILMASQALTRAATSPDDYVKLYSDILASCDHPVILHWLGEMFDPALAGYWGVSDFSQALDIALSIIHANEAKVDGIKISLLDKDKEIIMRRRLPKGVKMYTGDDFNYPELIAGDDEGFSHALLVDDPLVAAAAHAVNQLSAGDKTGFQINIRSDGTACKAHFSCAHQPLQKQAWCFWHG